MIAHEGLGAAHGAPLVGRATRAAVGDFDPVGPILADGPAGRAETDPGVP